MSSSETLHDTQPPGPGQRSVDERPFLIVALECERPTVPPMRLDLGDVDRVEIGRGAARTAHRFDRDGHRVLRINIPTSWMSATHALIERTAAGWVVSDAGSKNGTFVDGDPVTASALAGTEVVEAGRTLLLYRCWDVTGVGAGDLDLAAGEGEAAMPTLSVPFHRQLLRLERIAASTLPVLLLGETGTGKEVCARALHARSGRTGAFVDVNCGALPEALVESELFGHRKGAFSGAVDDHVGLVRAADGGTLLLDEIAELPASSQVALLRVLQEGAVRAVGDTRAHAVDVRVVAATLQDLPARVAEGAFREDLFARLAGVTVELPPLRARRVDIGQLFGALLARHASRAAATVRVTRAAARALFTYDWPLNVRELEHAVRAAVALAGADPIDLVHLPAPVVASLQDREPTAPFEPPTRDRTLHDQLRGLLAENAGNVSAVARVMGKAPNQIYRWLRRLRIDPGQFRE